MGFAYKDVDYILVQPPAYRRAPGHVTCAFTFQPGKTKVDCLSFKCVVNFHIVALANSLQAPTGPLGMDFIDENQEDGETIR
jgi:hypothetical protein